MHLDEVRNSRGESGIAIFKWGRPDWTKPEYNFDFHPYFYQSIKERIPKGIISSEVTDRMSSDGTTLRKIVCYKSEDIHKLRSDRHYDANLPFSTRAWLDLVNEVKEDVPVKFYIDIEAASDGRPLTDKFIHESPIPIIIIGTFNTRTNETILFAWRSDFTEQTLKMENATIYVYPSEVRMAQGFMKFWRFIQPDLVMAYNLDHYDWRVIANRFRKVGIDLNQFSPILQSVDSENKGFRPKGISTLDLLKCYKYLHRKSLESNSLDAVCKKELGYGKKTGVDTSHMADEWNKDFIKCLAYNVDDVNIMVELDKKMKISDTYIQFASVYGLNTEDTEHPSNMTGNYIMRRTPLIYPSYQLPMTGFKGAEPDVPNVGLHHNLLCLDFSGAYSAAMELLNSDPSTLLESPTPGCIEIDGVYFKQHSEQLGHYIKIIRDLQKWKSYWGKIKKSCTPMSPEWEQAELLRYAYKVGLLTIYGMTGQAKSRFYEPKIAKSVTYFLRGAIKFATHEAKKAGYERIYGHTDSVFVKGHGNDLDKLIQQGNELSDLINQKMPIYAEQYGIKHEEAGPFQIEFEKIAKTGFFSKKTRYGLDTWWYAGKIVNPKDAIEIKGFDSLRGDTPPYAKPIQKQLITDILRGKPRKDIDQEIKNKLDPIRKGEIPMFDLSVKNELQKDLNQYPKGHPHSVGAIFSNKYLGTGFENGTNARLLPVKTNGMTPESTPYICIDETVKSLPNWISVDWEKCYNKVLAKVGLVYESAGWDIRSISGQKKLFDFGILEI